MPSTEPPEASILMPNPRLSSSTPRPRRLPERHCDPALRRGLWVLVGVLLLQAAWIFAVPPFRGSDEFDHAFRAAGVATGQWHLSQQAADGRGALVWVPKDLADAASAQCAQLSYTGPDNCVPVQERGDRALIATAAAPYNPTYYALVGVVARPFHGSAALYAMRIATAVLSAALLALGAGLLVRAGSGLWTTLGLVAAIMPEVVYSTSVAAPDGPEMALGFVLWGALLAAVGEDGPVRSRWPVAIASVASALLMFTRQLGPLWVLAIMGSVVCYWGTATTLAVVRVHRRALTMGAILVGLGGCWWAGWQWIASHVSAPTYTVVQSGESHLWILAFNLPAWILQMIGVFPYRDQPAPLWIYPLALLVIGLFTVGAFRVARGSRARRVVGLIVLASLLIPVIASVALMPTYGAIWQGRYEVPFVIGILPLFGLVLDRRQFATVEGPRIAFLALVALALCHVVSVVSVMHRELGSPISTRYSGWEHPSLVVVGLLAGLGCAVLARTVWEAWRE